METAHTDTGEEWDGGVAAMIERGEGLLKKRVTTLEHYHLGSGRASYGYQVNDAYAVHEQMLWLPIGLAYAC